MPIYEYRCGACSHELEALQRVNDSPLRKCPECGKLFLRRLMSAPSFRLKGGGWYETDFKRDGETKRNLVETAGGESTESSGSTAADAGKTSGGDAPAKTGDAPATSGDAPAKADAAAKESAKKPAAEKPAARSAKTSTRKTRGSKPARN